MLFEFKLPNELPDEKIIKVVRRDLFVLLKKVLLLTLMTIAPLLLSYLLISGNPEIFSAGLFYPIFVLFSSAYYLFIWVFFFFSFLDYYLDVWIITSERVIDINQRGFFSRVISELHMKNIQDVTSEMHGLWGTILSFGNVHIQSAGSKEKFLFAEVPDPESIRNLIIRLSDDKKKKGGDGGE